MFVSDIVVLLTSFGSLMSLFCGLVYVASRAGQADYASCTVQSMRKVRSVHNVTVKDGVNTSMHTPNPLQPLEPDSWTYSEYCASASGQFIPLYLHNVIALKGALSLPPSFFSSLV